MPTHEFEPIVEALRAGRWCALPAFLAPDLTAELRAEALSRFAEGNFRRAGVGSGAAHSVRDEIRGDWIRWLEPPYSDAQARYLAMLEALRRALNESLMLGLFDVECHFALYPPGAGYQRHLDRFRNDSRRTVSCIVYLNDDWLESDGGVLRLYRDDTPQAPHEDILPRGGTLACFGSADIWHEVRPATRERLALTGWFRTRA